MSEHRRATAADAAAMTRVARLAYEPYVARMAGQRPAPMDVDYAAVCADAGAGSGTEAWVLEQDGVVAGLLVLVVEGDTLMVENVAVSPHVQGRGLGRGLLALAEERAVASGCRRLTLYTNAVMTENLRRYERLGFVVTHRGIDGGYDRVHHEKRLVGPG